MANTLSKVGLLAGAGALFYFLLKSATPTQAADQPKPLNGIGKKKSKKSKSKK